MVVGLGIIDGCEGDARWPKEGMEVETLATAAPEREKGEGEGEGRMMGGLQSRVAPAARTKSRSVTGSMFSCHSR